MEVTIKPIFASTMTPISVVIFFLFELNIQVVHYSFFFRYISKDKLKVNLLPELIRYQIMSDTRNILRETTNKATCKGFFQIFISFIGYCQNSYEKERVHIIVPIIIINRWTAYMIRRLGSSCPVLNCGCKEQWDLKLIRHSALHVV